MQIVGPDTLTVGAANTIDDPAQEWGNPSEAVQIQNSSPYQLSVVAAGGTLSIQPFTAQTIEISGQPITVEPTNISGSSQACVVTFAFLLGAAPQTGVQLPSGNWVETPPQQDGPLTAAAIASALSTQATIDILLAPTHETTGAGVVQLTITSKHAYNALVIQATPTASTPVYATVLNAEGQSFGAAMQAGLNNSGATYQAVVPCVNVAGDSFTVSVWFVAASAGALIGVQGSTASPLPSMRSDGRAYPIGQSIGENTIAAAGTVTVVNAPVVSLQRVMLKSLAFSAFQSATGTAITVNVTIGGTTTFLFAALSASLTDHLEWDSGLLLDIGTAVTLQQTGAAAGFAAAIYDIVV